MTTAYGMMASEYHFNGKGGKPLIAQIMRTDAGEYRALIAKPSFFKTLDIVSKLDFIHTAITQDNLKIPGVLLYKAGMKNVEEALTALMQNPDYKKKNGKSFNTIKEIIETRFEKQDKEIALQKTIVGSYEWYNNKIKPAVLSGDIMQQQAIEEQCFQQVFATHNLDTIAMFLKIFYEDLYERICPNIENEIIEMKATQDAMNLAKEEIVRWQKEGTEANYTDYFSKWRINDLQL